MNIDVEQQSLGIQKIALERWEQINKHGYDIKTDSYYSENELIKAALYAINPDMFEFPFNWDSDARDKIYLKSKIERYTVAGAFIVAAIDREIYLETIKKL